MAFPTIPTTGAGRLLSNTQADTSGTRTFPNLSGLTKNSGDLLIAICIVYQSSASAGAVFSGWGGGFTEFCDVGGSTSNMSIGAAYKVSTGAETGTFTVTQAATVTGHAAMFLMSIPGASASIAPVAGTVVHGTTTSANIAALNPATWGTLDTLWIAVSGNGETATTGSFTGGGAEPTNYTNIAFTGISADVVGGVEGTIAFRQLNAASEDPGAFTVDTSAARNSALLLAVSPAATSYTITLVQETDSAQTVSGTTHALTVTPATETDAVGTIVPLQPLPATTTASALPISTQSGHGITPATVTASAQALDVDKKVTITQAAETDTVLASGGKTVTLAAETDTAVALTLQHATYGLTPATETDLAGDIIDFQPLPALTTDSPQVLTVSQGGLHLTPATSTASVQILSFTQGGGHAIAPASETDLANTIVPLQPLPATVTATAMPLAVIYGGRNIAPALETDSARPVAPSPGINLVQWEATAPLPYNTKVAVGDLSTAVALTKTSGVGSNKTILPATEIDKAGGAGQELLPNGEFSLGSGIANWNTHGTGSRLTGTFNNTTPPALNGSWMGFVEAVANGGIKTPSSEWIVVSPSTEYTLTAWYYSATSFVANTAWSEYDDNDVPTAGAATGGLVPANTWTRQTFTFTTSASTTQIEVLLTSTTAHDFYVDSVSLVLANAAPLRISKQVPLPLVTTTASAQALTKTKNRSITTATTTSSVLGLVFQQLAGTHYTIPTASETDTATTLSIFKLIFVSLLPALEHDLARFTRAANRPSGGLALIDHDPDSGLILIDASESPDLALIDI